MVDPALITNYGMSQEQLEEFLLFAIAVAGKNADTTARALERFLALGDDVGPFQAIRNMSPLLLMHNLKKSRIGMYGKLVRAFTSVATGPFDLKTVLPEQLEEIHGIGPKTARFFVLHTQENTRYAVLDTHILKWLRTKGYLVPKTTPTGRRYAEIEESFLEEADAMGTNPAELDLAIWNFYHKSPKITTPVRD